MEKITDIKTPVCITKDPGLNKMKKKNSKKKKKKKKKKTPTKDAGQKVEAEGGEVRNDCSIHVAIIGSGIGGAATRSLISTKI